MVEKDEEMYRVEYGLCGKKDEQTDAFLFDDFCLLGSRRMVMFVGFLTGCFA